MDDSRYTDDDVMRIIEITSSLYHSPFAPLRLVRLLDDLPEDVTDDVIDALRIAARGCFVAMPGSRGSRVVAGVTRPSTR